MNDKTEMLNIGNKKKRNEDEAEFRLRLSKLLAKFRIRKGMTQKEVAEKIGITTNALALYETNHAMPSLFTLSKMIHIIEIDLYAMFNIQEHQTVMVFKDGQVETYIVAKKEPDSG